MTGVRHIGSGRGADHAPRPTLSPPASGAGDGDFPSVMDAVFSPPAATIGGLPIAGVTRKDGDAAQGKTDSQKGAMPSPLAIVAAALTGDGKSVPAAAAPGATGAAPPEQTGLASPSAVPVRDGVTVVAAPKDKKAAAPDNTSAATPLPGSPQQSAPPPALASTPALGPILVASVPPPVAPTPPPAPSAPPAALATAAAPPLRPDAVGDVASGTAIVATQVTANRGPLANLGAAPRSSPSLVARTSVNAPPATAAPSPAAPAPPPAMPNATSPALAPRDLAGAFVPIQADAASPIANPNVAAIAVPDSGSPPDAPPPDANTQEDRNASPTLVPDIARAAVATPRAQEPVAQADAPAIAPAKIVAPPEIDQSGIAAAYGAVGAAPDSSPPAAAMSAAPPPLSPAAPAGFGDGLSHQLLSMIGTGRQEATLHLQPPELGALEVRVAVAGREVSTWFGSPQPQVQQALNDAIGQLRSDLAGAGLNLAHAWVGSDASAARRQLDGAPAPRRGNTGMPRAAAPAPATEPRPRASGVSIYV